MDTGLVCRSGRIALYSGPGMRGCGEKWTYQDQQEQHFSITDTKVESPVVRPWSASPPRFIVLDIIQFCSANCKTGAKQIRC